MTALRLVAPAAEYLLGHAAALRQGWSPNKLRDVSAEQRAAIALGAGRVVPRLPGPVRWRRDAAPRSPGPRTASPRARTG